ncbi:huntingtin-interacting protein K [Penaeus vannamei]|uniref:Putative huntingtin-interacting protein K n=1 Tax=Penaeus vannamei TaxID=6689 RepID=A0A3R7NN65_PENVA|nr:huntingtin-interacting protein K-like [Penaeus vannamei]XP_037782310.1 huntingtin-interacting protein K-like [Penaeus monodon]XP_047471991.1 huntingtin-interacting protein K-like [Penaeus chinensis]ROT62400.1 putative huntingtin-interacting protein K [Penaeus vannamei]
MSQEENHDMEEEVETKSKDKKAAKHDSGAADLEKVTNYAEEKEIKSNANFMSVINDVKKQDEATRSAKEQELMKVSIKKEDVELIMKELEIPKVKAERALREHQGNLIETLVTLTN